MLSSDAIHARSLLWETSDFCRARHEKSAAALVALQGTLRKHRPLGGREQEFLSLYERVAKTDPEIFSAAWSTPYAYAWVRTAFELLRGMRGQSEISSGTQSYARTRGAACPATALEQHLQQFKRLALAMAAGCDGDWTFDRPLEAALPIALPGSRWSLAGSGTISIHGISQGRLNIVTSSGRAILAPLREQEPFLDREITRHWCPAIDFEGCQLLMQPHAFHVPGVASGESLSLAGMEFQWQHRGLLQETLALVERYDPETFAQFRDSISVVALKRLSDGDYGNTTFSRMPGAFLTSAVRNPLAMAEDFIHEMYHNRLFALEEQGPFFARNSEAHEDARYYSPWRSDPRPLYGLLHALYVFTRVCHFWLRVYGDEYLPAADRRYVEDRLIRIPVQLEIAVETLRESAQFTAWGGALFQEMALEVARQRVLLGQAAVPADGPALTVAEDGTYKVQRSAIDCGPLSVREALREHRHLCERAASRAS